MTQEPRSKHPEVRLFAGARKSLRYVLLSSTLATAFWVLQFAYQYLSLIPGELGGSLLRSFALSGATLIGTALIIGPLRTIFAKYNFVRHRRTAGVWGFTFIIMHFLSVITFLFEFDILALFWHPNPFANPILFAVSSFPIFTVMWATSTDWAVAKLGFRRWKAIHRLVFIAYISAVLHFSLINPELLLNPFGYVLIATTVTALSFETVAFIKTVRQRGLGKGAMVGLSLMVLAVSMFTTAYGFKEAVVGDVKPNPRLPMSLATVRMKDFMKQKGGNPDIALAPIPGDKAFEASAVKSGTFQRLNYMTSGSVTLEKRGNSFFVVLGDDFSTPNGPDLVVYLTRNSSPTTRQDISNGILLSPLKSTTGKQVYEIPSATDVSQYGSVTIHCRAFNVPWSYAPFR